MPEADAVALWNWDQNRGGFAAVSAYLHARDVSAFNPGATPPMTEAKMIMVEQGRSMSESYLVDIINRRLGDFSEGVVAAPFYALCDRLQGQAAPGVKLVPAALMHALKEAGWHDCGRLASRDYTTKKHIYCAPELVSLSKSELRRLGEKVSA